VINATGVVLHTNLGRAPLATDAASAVADVAGTPTSNSISARANVVTPRHPAGPILDALASTHPPLDVLGLDAIAVNNCAATVAWPNWLAVVR
jgi:L-seryl-tRNA(Ser) seleniumtransferase